MNDERKTATLLIACAGSIFLVVVYTIASYVSCDNSGGTPVRGAFTFVCVETAK